MKISLKTKIVLIIVAILLLTTGAGSVVSTHIFSDVYSRALKSKASATGVFLASQMDRLLALGIPIKELVGFEAQCREIVKKHEVVSYAMVVDMKGRILFHNDPSRHGNTLSPARLKAIKDFKGDWVDFSEGGEGYYESIIPVFGGRDRHVGDIIIGFPESIVSKETKRLAAYSTGVSLIFFAIAVFLLVFALTSWISNPLVQLLAAIHELANKGGDFAGKVEIASGDEIGELATAFNRMTEKLRQTTVSRDYADAIIESMTDILIVTDRDFKIVQANRAACELLNYQNRELRGKDMQTVFMADEKTPLIRLLKDLSENTEMRNHELNLRTREGKSIPVLFSAADIRDKEGHLSRIVHVGKDITERKLADEALREERDKLKEALAKVRTLSGLLPICANCKKIRDDKGYWNQIETFISRHSGTEFSHGICPHCAEELYPDYFEEDEMEEPANTE